MSAKLLLAILLTVVYKQAEGEDNRICECNTKQDVKDNEDLWALLKKLDKLAEAAPEEEKMDYAVAPGVLDQLGCNCDEKSRIKREVADVELPEEVVKDTKDDLDGIRGKEHKMVPYEIDLRCAKGTFWLAAAKTCVPVEESNEEYE